MTRRTLTLRELIEMLRIEADQRGYDKQVYFWDEGEWCCMNVGDVWYQDNNIYLSNTTQNNASI